MLKILINCCLLGVLVLAQHGRNATLCLCRFAMQDFVELSIAFFILFFEGGRRHLEVGMEAGWVIDGGKRGLTRELACLYG
jgi:hypothetical protein